MADTGEVNVKLKVTAETGGADEVKNSLEKTKGSFLGVTRAASLFQKILAGFGVVGLFTSLAGAVDRLTAGVRKSREEAEKLAQEQAKALDAQRVKDMAAAYKKLEDSIAAATAERSRANEIEDLETAAQREGEDLAREAAREEELAALKPSDPLYNQKKSQIEAKYSAQGATVKATRAKEDAERASRREEEEAIAKAEEAGRRSLALNDDRARLAELMDRKRQASLRSETENEYDASGFLESFGNNVRAIVEGISSGDFSRYGSDRTKQGDKVREDARVEAEDLQRQIDELEARIAAKEQGIANLNAESDQAAKRSAIYAIKGDNAGKALEIAASSGARTVEAADKERAAEEEKRTSALAAESSLKEEKADIQSRLAELQARKDAAGMAVYQAQNSYDASKLGGNRAAQQSAFGNLQSARDAALEVDAAVDGTIKALNDTLKNIETRLKAAQSYMESQAKQTRFAWSEQPPA